MVGTWSEHQLVLAVQALQKDPKLSVRKAAKIYNVPRTTLANRRDGQQTISELSTNRRKLAESEENAIVRYIIDLDSRSFPPRISNVRDMADRLLALRDGGHVGVNWTSKFVQRRLELQTRLNRRIDYKRVQCEDPDAYRA